MSEELKQLLDAARKVEMAPRDKESQRRSFAWGNTHFENERVTKDVVRKAAESLEMMNDPQD